VAGQLKWPNSIEMVEVEEGCPRDTPAVEEISRGNRWLNLEN
jgi:hypothetical protein